MKKLKKEKLDKEKLKKENLKKEKPKQAENLPSDPPKKPCKIKKPLYVATPTLPRACVR